MNRNTLWSLRLGFSCKQAQKIESLGLQKFLEQSFNVEFDETIPEFLSDSPKTWTDLKELKKLQKSENKEALRRLVKKEMQTSFQMKSWWIDKMIKNDLPLVEKMTCFWHNHYVATFQKVKVNHWVFRHNQLLRKNAFGNFKDLTKQVLRTNAIVRYLDNVDNKKGKLNENLSRELLELFTLGIGNYTEDDIKNGAKALAGLTHGEEEAQYRKSIEDNNPITYLGKKGIFKSDELVDIIFEQKNIPYLITRKILKWFIYDNPPEELVTYYGDYFKKEKFEIKPLLIKIFTEEYIKNTAGSKIKNPLEYVLQIIDELNIEQPNTKLIAVFIRDQGMDLFNQPNVKGWVGGNAWLTSQVYLQRNNVADLLSSGKNLSKRKSEKNTEEMMEKPQNDLLNIKLNWNKKGNNKAIIAELQERLLFDVDEATQKDFETILKYDFDGTTVGADNAVLRLFNAILKTPEFQLI